MGLRGRTAGATVGLAAAFLSLKPVGPLDRLLNLALLPTRVVASVGVVPSAIFAGGSRTSDAEAEAERRLSIRLERAVLASAWPLTSRIPPSAAPIPGEVDARQGARRDYIMVRVTDATAVMPGHPVIAGDAYVGYVERIPWRQPIRDDPGILERFARRVGLSSPPQRPSRDLVEVALITGSNARVGAIIPRDQDGQSCRLVVGGLFPRSDRIWLSAHNPESRATLAGEVFVHELFERVNGFDSLAEGFPIGELRREEYSADGSNIADEIIGIQPLVDFESGLNQVLILAPGSGGGAQRSYTSGEGAADELAIPVLEDGGWIDARLLSPCGTTPWRSSLRIAEGSRAGIRPGAALVEGVRLLGRVDRADSGGSTVALLDDPGFEIAVIAQSELEPDSAPLVLGAIRHDGAPDGAPRFTWKPEGGSLHAKWIARHGDADGAPVVLWTGSGMAGVPRGLLVGRTVLPAASLDGDEGDEGDDEDADDADGPGEADANANEDSGPKGPVEVELILTGTGSLAGDLQVRTRATRKPGAAR